MLGRALGHVNAPYQGFAQVNRCSALESKTGGEKVTNYLPRLRTGDTRDVSSGGSRRLDDRTGKRGFIAPV